MRRGLGTTAVANGLAVMALTSGCAAINDGTVSPELGADARVGAQQTMHCVVDWNGTAAVHRVDATWTDSCTHASNSGFFQPASGTTCRIDAGATARAHRLTRYASPVRRCARAA